LRNAIQRLASVDSTVLLQGESGTGKELVARELHHLSARAQRPFVPVHCMASSPEWMERELLGHVRGAFHGARQSREGLLHYAQGGTLFLDEVAELPLSLQATLLKVLEDMNIQPLGSRRHVPINVRLMAATNRDLGQAVAQGQFRADLYYRLKVADLHLPPLRAHKEDLPLLVAHFMAQLAPVLGVLPLTLSPQELDYLHAYNWPGNCRELRNLLERSLILGELNVSALYPNPKETHAPGWKQGVPVDLHTLEKQHIMTILKSVDGDKTKAAHLLGISRRTLERRAAEWGWTG
jgi:DNA-binding NtrC family response regulator